MAFLRQLLLILVVLVLSGGEIFASSREQRDFAAAADAFKDGMWSRAEVEFARFIEKYPKSGRVAEAALMQAQADFNQGKWIEAVNLLQARESLAGSLAGDYAYWIGQAQFTNADFGAAANTFAQLADTFTNSQWRLNAVVNEAAAYAKLSEWEKTQTVLQERGGIFQEAARTNGTDSRVLNGWLLLAQAMVERNQPAEAAAILQSPGGFIQNPQMDWQRLYLLCQAQLADGRTNEALASTTNLLKVADRAGRPDFRGLSVLEQASVLERNGRVADALPVYEEMLTNGSPGDLQRRAIFKAADLSAAQTNFPAAEDALEQFQSRFPDSTALDSVVLELGELHLKSYTLSPTATNDLLEAHAYFDQFINTFTNSACLGKAYLDRGWCFWLEGKWAASAADFRMAVQNLPPSADLAVAHFKLGDAEFQENNFAGARDDYHAVVNEFTNFPVVSKSLGAQAHYQALRACLTLKDYAGASNDLAQILKIYPVSNVAEEGIVLEGEALSDLGQSDKARALFQKFEDVFPNSPQLPEVEIAIARTYEQELNWPMAISVYDSWVGRYSNDRVNLPPVEYARAWATFESGNETNAFVLFTSFIGQFPNHGLAQLAQWWLGDYYYGQGDWVNAEKNYKLLFQKWPASPFAYQAELMAGRAAMGRQDYDDAIDSYLMNLTGDTNCPGPLDLLALFAYGDAEMQMPSKDPNNALANFPTAIKIFSIICQTYPGTPDAAHAWGEIGDCDLQLANYKDATNAYWQVMASPAADIAARSQAQVGIGQVYERLAALTATNQTMLLQSALNDYLDVFFGNNLRNGETADPFWIKEAGLHALPLMDSLGAGDANKFIDQMEGLLPQIKDSLEKKRLELSHPGF